MIKDRPLRLEALVQLAAHCGVLLGAEGDKNVVEAIEITTDAAMTRDCACQCAIRGVLEAGDIAVTVVTTTAN